MFADQMASATATRIGAIPLSLYPSLNSNSDVILLDMRALNKRNEEIARMYAEGMRQIDIAARFDITQSRVGKIIKKAAREGHGALRSPPEGMSLRCAQVIQKATQLWPSSATADALRDRRVGLIKSDGVGRKTVSALNAWLVRVAKGKA